MSTPTDVIDAIAQALAAREEDQRLAEHPQASPRTKADARQTYETVAAYAVHLLRDAAREQMGEAVKRNTWKDRTCPHGNPPETRLQIDAAWCKEPDCWSRVMAGAGWVPAPDHAKLVAKLEAARLMAARIEGLRLRLNGVAPSHENDEASLPFWFTPLLEAKFAWDAAGGAPEPQVPTPNPPIIDLMEELKKALAKRAAGAEEGKP